MAGLLERRQIAGQLWNSQRPLIQRKSDDEDAPARRSALPAPVVEPQVEVEIKRMSIVYTGHRGRLIEPHARKHARLGNRLVLRRGEQDVEAQLVINLGCRL